MSYYETVGGLGRHGFSEGMGATFPVSSTPNESLRQIQQALQSMSLLAPGTGPTGADGRWGLHTGGALQQAKTRLGRTGAPFTLARGGRSVDIPDDFIAAIVAAAAPAGGTVSLPTTTHEPDVSTTVPGALPSTPMPPAIEETTSRSHMRLYVIGGSVLAVAGIAAFMFWPKSTTPNRHRRMRRNRRRR